jgi:hypothetical protein
MNDKKSSVTAVGKISKNTPATSPEKLVDEIRNRAFEIHLKRGSTPGSDMDDWLNAEREIKAKYHLSC